MCARGFYNSSLICRFGWSGARSRTPVALSAPPGAMRFSPNRIRKLHGNFINRYMALMCLEYHFNERLVISAARTISIWGRGQSVVKATRHAAQTRILLHLLGDINCCVICVMKIGILRGVKLYCKRTGIERNWDDGAQSISLAAKVIFAWERFAH